jgi:hypothetical protein
MPTAALALGKVQLTVLSEATVDFTDCFDALRTGTNGCENPHDRSKPWLGLVTRHGPFLTHGKLPLEVAFPAFRG